MASAAVSRSPIVRNGSRATPAALGWIVFALFFVSGIPALIYQIAWQRALFAIYGVNIESVAVVVSVFMLGLGVGSIIGGRLSKMSVPLLALFAGAEAATGVYGLCSLHLFHYVALSTAGAPLLKTAGFVFLLLIIPTVLMGSTLPLLLAHIVKQLPNVGRATGLLYFVNTLGSACACLLTGMFLMRRYGLTGAVRLAGIVNLVIATCVFLEYIRTRNRQEEISNAQQNTKELCGTELPLPMSLGMLLAGVSGFIALAYEIIWCRVFSFATANNPKVFAYVLGAYLIGISVGSLIAERICKQSYSAREGAITVGTAIFGANLWALFVTPEFANLYADMPRIYGMLIGFIFVAFAAAFLSISFPLLCHLCIEPNQSAGSKLSYLYFSNIVGSSLGSFVVGYMMFEYFSLRNLSVILAGLGLFIGVGLLVQGRASLKRVAAFSLVAILALCVGRIRLVDTYETLAGLRWAEVVENRHDVITVGYSGAIFSGGGYDGVFNISPVSNSNWILRIYTALTLHPAPKNVLMIGLSSGSWAQVIANDPRVDHLTVVEINPGYLKLIPNHPEVASLLQNPKVNVVIDDGRRWMIAHPAEHYDFIVMNTPYHWRANISNLLSQEFVEIVKRHLNPNGVYFFNTTYSPEAQLTACVAFRNVVRIANFLAVSDAPLRLDAEQLTRSLLDYRIDGKLVVTNPSAPDVVRQLDLIRDDVAIAEVGTSANGVFEYGPSLRARVQGARIVTDDNMAVEWHHDLVQN